jgi:hypothetical protein
MNPLDPMSVLERLRQMMPPGREHACWYLFTFNKTPDIAELVKGPAGPAHRMTCRFTVHRIAPTDLALLVPVLSTILGRSIAAQLAEGCEECVRLSDFEADVLVCHRREDAS